MRVSESISMKTSWTNTPVIPVTVVVNCQPAVMVIPSYITLMPGPLPNAMTNSVTIQNNSTNSLLLTEPSVNLPGVDIKLNEIQPGRVFNITLSFPAGFSLPPGDPVALTMKSSNQRMPLVKVPILQQPKPFVPQAGPSAVPRPAVPTAPVSNAGHS